MNVAGHDSNLALTWLDDTWAVRSNKTSLGLRLHDRLNLDHIEGGDTLSDADNEVHLSLDSLQDGVGGEGRGHINDGGLGIGGGLGVLHGAEDGQTEMLGASLTLVDATNDLGAIGKCLLSVESTL